MTDLFTLIFSSVWTYFGTLLLVWSVMAGVVSSLGVLVIFAKVCRS